MRHTVRAGSDEPYAADLDIFGHASLFHLLDTLTTHTGETILASWLRNASSSRGTSNIEDVRRRQDAVAELSPMVDFRDELEQRGRLISEQRPDPEQFLTWAESDPWLAHRPWFRWGAIASVLALWLLLIAEVLDLVYYPLWAIIAAINCVYTLTVGRKVYELLEQAAEGEAGFRHFGAAFDLICGANVQSRVLKRAQVELGKRDKGESGEGGMEAAHYARRLYRLTTLVTSGSSLIYILVQSATLWDTHLLAALERWQKEAGKRARTWLHMLGEVEALSALARLAHDNPDWAIPEIDPEAESLEARDLGHPLIPESRRVDNDVEVGPPGTFLLVTGSNMSGKSTLLRALGVNIVLAWAGGPVCASSMRLPPVDLWTSMRVEDSLEHGVSYYMAELQRLKRVVDAARLDHSERAKECRLFYLLDEILQGTNTVERQIAARRVIMYLARQGAIGAVSTHDLTLTDAPEVAAASRQVHFTETLSNKEGDPAMTFDYKLRPGIATSTNALRLMEVIGLDLSEDQLPDYVK
jgi:DNA mismatch repair ATPase MutS